MWQSFLVVAGWEFFAFRAKLVISGDSGEIRCGEAEVGGSLKIFVFPVNSGQSRAFLVFPPLARTDEKWKIENFRFSA